MAKTVSEHELRAVAGNLLDGIRDRGNHVLVTRGDVPIAALVPVDYVAALEETIEILSDRKTSSALDQGLSEIAHGETVPLDEIGADLHVVRSCAAKTSRSQLDEAD